MKSAGRPILAAIRSRGYAAQAAAARADAGGRLPAQQVKVTRLPSGTAVASLENYSPVSQIMVVYNAGSRHENGNNQGVTHALRSAVNLSTQNSTNFGVVRNVQQIGGYLGCSSSREYMMYHLSCLRNGLDTGLECLQEVSGGPACKPWEVPDLDGPLRLELANLATQPQVRLIEALHAAAFRNTLGRSIYMAEKRIGSHSPEVLSQFVQNNYLSGNMTIVGMGVDHDALLFAAKKFKVTQGSTDPEPAKYHGGEVRIDEPGSLSSVALVTQGASMGSADLLAVGVLQQVMGTGPYVKYGTNISTSKVSQAAAVGSGAPFAAQCINATYSDAGLFGFQVTAQAEEMAGVLKNIVGAFSDATKGSITQADVDRAKNQFVAAMAMDQESSSMHLGSIAMQVAISGEVFPAAELEAAINKISLADVQNVAKKVINAGKPTMAAVGNLSNTPYLDELL